MLGARFARRNSKNNKLRFLRNAGKPHAEFIYNRFSPKETLISLIRGRQNFNEIRTNHQIEKCQEIISSELDVFFNKKASALNFADTSLAGFSNDFFNDDLKKLLTKIEAVVLSSLQERFGISVKWQLSGIDCGNWLSEIYKPIVNYKQARQRTVLTAAYMETLSSRTLNYTVESLVNRNLSTALFDIEISEVLLPFLGIDSNREISDLKQELSKRINGALCSIRLRLLAEINIRMAQVFYETNDLINSYLEGKIQLLAEKTPYDFYQDPQDQLLQA